MITPVNPNATVQARAVLDYLHSIRGKGLLTGQHTKTIPQEELAHIRRMTGRLPALCGFELLGYSPNINYASCDDEARREIDENRNTLQKAFEWAEKGGLVTMTWHWFSPLYGQDKSFFARNTDFDASRVLEEGTPERAAFYHDLDVMAEHLRAFQEKGIPILWRPFHEAEGNWFWWGAKGMDTARQLYRLMFDYYTQAKHLDHLIWVWNNPRAAGYVGDTYCDIVTADTYPAAHDHHACRRLYDELRATAPGKPLAIGEIGTLPSAAAIAAEGLDWLWYMAWCGDFVTTEHFTSASALQAMYAHPYAITLDKLPRLY